MSEPREGGAGGLAAKGAQAVTAAVPAAARAGLEILKAGGNAYDAAVAAALAETVWLPMKCGLGGDLVALCRAPDGAFQSLIAIGGGPAALAAGAKLQVKGPASVGPPGAPAGYAALAEQGRLGLAELVEPALEAAEQGVAWLPIAAALTREAESDLRHHSGATSFLPGGALPEAGATLRLPGLAALLTAFQGAGAALFHDELGAKVVARLSEAGGFLDLEDLRAARATWRVPEELHLPDGATLLATPLPTHGPLLLEAFRRAEEGEEPEHRAFAAAALAFQRSAQDAGTSVVGAVDAEGNAVVIVHSNSFPQYGSCVVVEDHDLVLNNRPGRGFALEADAGHWNAPRAGRIPFTTLHAWALADEVGDWLGATPGGRNQVPWNLQTLRRLRESGGRAEEALLAPKWGYDAAGDLVIEDGGGIAQDEAPGLRPVPTLSLRSAEQLLYLQRHGPERLAAADPRIGAVAFSTGTSPGKA